MFAENLLLKHGWEKGKGLGKKGHGMSEAIKVKVKCDNAGVGHNMGEQFTFHWWDHAFNRAASSITVESSQDGVQVKKVSDEKENGMISSRKPRKKGKNKNDMLYGHFIKSATLLSQGEKTEKVSENSESSAEDKDEKLDLSSARRLTDEELVRACGGLTAHKGARHGLTMNAKLARLEEQEKEFLAKYGKNMEVSYSKRQEQPEIDKEKEKKKKCSEPVCFSSLHYDSSWNGKEVPKLTDEEDDSDRTDKLTTAKTKMKNSKRKEMELEYREMESGATILEERECKRKKKKKKKHKRNEDENFTASGTELRTASPALQRKNEHREELTGSEAECENNSCKIKKKKKKLKHVA